MLLVPNKKKIGIVAAKSNKNHPFRYFEAINQCESTNLPSTPLYCLKKLNTISRVKLTSTQLSLTIFYLLQESKLNTV